MPRCVLLLLSLLIPFTPSFAQKEYKQLRSYIKSGSNLDKALELVEQCKQDSLMGQDPRLYALAYEVEKERNEEQNTKLYLKQSYDTAVFFSSIYGIFDNMLLWDEKEGQPDSKGRIRHNSRDKIHSTLLKYYPNLFAGGLYHLKKKSYDDAHNMFSLYLDLADNDIFVADSLQKTDTHRPRAAFWALLCSFEQKDYEGVFKYSKLARQDTTNIDICLQYEVMANSHLGRTDAMLEALKLGILIEPQNHYFFTHLIDYYNSELDYQSSLNLCQLMIESDTTEMLYHFARGTVLFNLRSYDECLEEMQTVLERDTGFVETEYFMASCYYNQAVDIEHELSLDMEEQCFLDTRQQMLDLYAQALPYMEAYRSRRPDDTARWGNPLYKMYLTLNDAEKFKEIEGILATEKE